MVKMKMTKSYNGMVMGKFIPFHLGHQLLIDTAMLRSDRLWIVIGDLPSDPIPVEIREIWVRDYIERTFVGESVQVEFVRDRIDGGSYTCDENGTITDETFWTHWLSAVGKDVPLETIDYVFTSDRYGKEVANRIGTKWFPVDPDRSLFPISGTEIRNSGDSDFLSPLVRHDLCKTVCLVGAESTGKSTMTKKLAKRFGTTYAPEWGRYASEANDGRLDEEDFRNIVGQQHLLIWRAKSYSSHGVCFTDTDALTTSLFAPYYLGKDMETPGDLLTPGGGQDFPLTLVLAPNIPFVQDGTRIFDDSGEREAFHKKLIDGLTRLKRRFVVIDQTTYEERFDAAFDEVEKMLKEPLDLSYHRV